MFPMAFSWCKRPLWYDAILQYETTVRCICSNFASHRLSCSRNTHVVSMPSILQIQELSFVAFAHMLSTSSNEEWSCQHRELYQNQVYCWSKLCERERLEQGKGAGWQSRHSYQEVYFWLLFLASLLCASGLSMHWIGLRDSSEIDIPAFCSNLGVTILHFNKIVTCGGAQSFRSCYSCMQPRCKSSSFICQMKNISCHVLADSSLWL